MLCKFCHRTGCAVFSQIIRRCDQHISNTTNFLHYNVCIANSSRLDADVKATSQEFVRVEGDLADMQLDRNSRIFTAKINSGIGHIKISNPFGADNRDIALDIILHGGDGVFARAQFGQYAQTNVVITRSGLGG